MQKEGCMKRIVFVILVVTVFTGSLWASNSQKGIIRSLYDVVAPVISGEPSSADRQVGQIFYDNSAGSFKGVNKNGGIDVLTTPGGGELPKAHAETIGGTLNQIETPVIFANESFDYGDIYDNSTGIFTAPSDGVYNLSVSMQLYYSMFAANDAVTMSVIKNGVDYLYNDGHTIWHTQNGINLGVESDILLVAGDTISVVAGGARGPTVLNIGYAAWATLKKVP